MNKEEKAKEIVEWMDGWELINDYEFRTFSKKVKGFAELTDFKPLHKLWDDRNIQAKIVKEMSVQQLNELGRNFGDLKVEPLFADTKRIFDAIYQTIKKDKE